ncbi:MAG TPA: NAD(P)-dependent alcohol dehydrogenase, partial [Thermoanaerobaculia bacterium]
MKAAVYARFGKPGEVVGIADVPMPVPADGEVLIKVRAAAVNPLDWRMMGGGPLLVRKLLRMAEVSRSQPGRPGRDVAGVVESTGRNATQFKPGDAVFGCCRGSFAEYATGAETNFVLKPENVSFEQAGSAGIAAVTALQGLRDRGRLQAGQKVLVNGAAGGVGTFAVQIAKAFGAHVTGVCSTGNVELVRSIGADRVIDYTREDYAKGSERYDVVMDGIANHSLSDGRRVLTPHGRWIVYGGHDVGAFLLRAVAAAIIAPFTSRHFGVFIARLSQKELAVLS